MSLSIKGMSLRRMNEDGAFFKADDLKALAYFQVLRNRGKSVSESASYKRRYKDVYGTARIYRTCYRRNKRG